MKQSTQNQQFPDFFAFSETLVKELIDDGRYGTSQSYSKAAASLKSFLLQSGETDTSLPVCEMDDTLIYKYNRYLSGRGVIRNSISFYNRVLRAIYNKAVKSFRIPDRHPFEDVYTGVDRTRKRAIGESSIARLITLDLRNDKSLELARDLFVISYLMRGISFVDMAYLKKSNVRGNYIVYKRKKTGASIEVKIEPQIRRLLNKYTRQDSDYLLPILQNRRAFDEEQTYRHYQAQLSIYNRKLKELSRRLREEPRLTSYVSRHSWATAARNNDVSMSIISEGLGHSSERMTRIYLGSFNEKLIDRANLKLMGRIQKYVSLRETNQLQRYI